MSQAARVGGRRVHAAVGAARDVTPGGMQWCMGDPDWAERAYDSGVSIVAFDAHHVPVAAVLVAGGVERLRRRVPELPVAWTDPAHVGSYLDGLLERGSGLAVVDDGELLAFQVARVLDGRGGKWSYTPDIAHAAPLDRSGRLRERLYAGLAETWVGGACPEHVVSILADDGDAQAAFARLGFGHVLVDLVRDLSPVGPADLSDGTFVRRAEPRDATALVGLDAGLRRHLQASPVFLRMGPAATAEVQRRHVEDPAQAVFVAEREGRPVACLRIGPCATDVAMVVRDAGTASITAAFTEAPFRGGGVASALLDAAVSWARDAGYERCAVDHESANREAGRFWARHFAPATLSMGRRLAHTALS
jgi:GNAT superfamily N-acetyltransferase